MSKRADLVYNRGCPNVAAARRALIEAFVLAGLPPRWREWDRSSPRTPARFRGYGSPTILVDGRDVGDEPPVADDASCRLYGQAEGRLAGVPSAALIAAALKRKVPSRRRSLAEAGKSALALVPGVGASVLPACPACLPVLTGAAGVAGVSFISEAWAAPLLALLLLLSLAALIWRARAQRRYGPMALGALGIGAIAAGKFLVVSDAPVYGGVLLLLAAAAWNMRVRRGFGKDSCPRCETAPDAASQLDHSPQTGG